MSEKKNKSDSNIRKASSVGMTIVIVCIIFVCIGLIAVHFWAQPTSGSNAQKAIQTEAATIYSAAQANVQAGTLVTDSEIVTTAEFPELPVALAVNALESSGELQGSTGDSLLTGAGLDPTMSQLETIINMPTYELQVNSSGQLTAIPSSN